MKVNSTVYKGIEYVQISALPSNQKERLLQTINRDLIINILIDGKLVDNCLQFKDYESWFDNIYSGEAIAVKEKKSIKENTTATTVHVSALKKA